MQVEIHTRVPGRCCKAAVRLDFKRRLPNDEIGVAAGPAVEPEDRAGQYTTPIGCLYRSHPGGFDALVERDKEGLLQP